MPVFFALFGVSLRRLVARLRFPGEAFTKALAALLNRPPPNVR